MHPAIESSPQVPRPSLKELSHYPVIIMLEPRPLPSTSFGVSSSAATSQSPVMSHSNAQRRSDRWNEVADDTIAFDIDDEIIMPRGEELVSFPEPATSILISTLNDIMDR